MKNLKKIIMSSLCVGILSISAVSAAGYVGYKLPRFQGNNYTNSHSKTTSPELQAETGNKKIS